MCISKSHPTRQYQIPYGSVIGRDVHLVEQRLGVYSHFNLTGHWLSQLAAVRNQHRQRHTVVLYQRCKSIDCNPNRGVLHDDCRALTAHECTSTKPHAFIFFVGWNMENPITILNLINDMAEVKIF